MLTIKETGTNRLDLDLTGKIDSDEMRVLLDEFVTKSEGIESGRILYRIHDFELPSISAIGVELKRLPGLLKVIQRYERIALISDKKWLRTLGEWEGKLIPGLDIKAFNPDEEAAAEAWLTN